MFKTGFLEATFSGVFNCWEILTDRFRITVKNLHIPKVEGLRTKYQKVKCENCIFDLKDDCLIVEAYRNIETFNLW